MLAYLYVIVNPLDRERLKRIVNVPRRKIGAKAIEALMAISMEQEKDPISIMRSAGEYTALSRNVESFGAFARMIDALRYELNGEISLEDFIRHLLDASGYRQMLVEAGAEERERLDNLEELISIATDFENEYRESAKTFVDDGRDAWFAQPDLTSFGALKAFLERCSLIADVDKYDESADAVVLMTMHSAKGLEFPVVFLPAMEEGVFPGTQNINSGETDDIEEERRLAYVAVTRAKDKIYVTHTRNRMLYNRTSYNPRSRFIEEIPEKLISDETPEYDTLAYVPRPTVKTYYSAPSEYRQVPQQRTPQSPYSASKPTPKPAPKPVEVLSVGDRVRHRVFGEGEIFSVKPMGADVLYEVIFDTVGTKKLMGSFAKLIKI